MKYVALLRGINVGGNSMIKMAALKAAFESEGFRNVVTYINSGNVVFESEQKNPEGIRDTLEKSLSKTFEFTLRIVIRSYPEIKKVVSNVPDKWNSSKDLRCYIAFVREPANAQEIAKHIDTKEGIDWLDLGDHIVYMTTKLSGLTKSSFSKLAGKPIYQDITIRNFNTTKKILELMEKS